MAARILVLDADRQSCQATCRIVSERGYDAVPVYALSDLDDHLKDCACMAVIMDIDSVAVNNRNIRNLTLDYPGVSFLCTSWDRFHPELQDAICYHIYACLNKPVDPEELFYWLKCIRDDFVAEG